MKIVKMDNNDNILSHDHVILIVDDNPYNLQVIGKILKDNQYKIEFATSGPAALDWINVRKFDLILLDINMPDMSGFDVCRKIRLNTGMNNVPIIFLSADTDRESILKGFELGAQDYVSKPFDSRELIVRIKTHLTLKDSLEKFEKLNKSLEEKVMERTLLLKESNENLESTNLKLIDLDKAKAEFLSLISHEIRTPLTGIVGSLELLKNLEYSSEIGELVEILDLSVKRLERFALDAVLITQLKTNAILIKKDKILLSHLLKEMLLEEKDKFHSKKITINLKNDPYLSTIFGDVDLIKKCIGNIIDNAIFFSPENGSIGISAYSEGNNTICEVHDQGKGFPSELTVDVFKLFTHGKEFIDNCPGTGLPIVKMIMELHGGNIILSNHSDGGALVKLLFLNNNGK